MCRTVFKTDVTSLDVWWVRFLHIPANKLLCSKLAAFKFAIADRSRRIPPAKSLYFSLYTLRRSPLIKVSLAG